MTKNRNHLQGALPKGQVDLVYRDDLTGLYNRRYLNLSLPQEISKAKDTNKKLSLCMIDCDGFKIINDTYGHLSGDQVLVDMASILQKQVGEKGRVVRYAGDEFIVIIPEKGLEESFKIMNDSVQLIAAHKIQLKNNEDKLSITLSGGIAVYPEDASNPRELIDKADQILYSAKRAGKNRVSTAKDILAESNDRKLVASVLRQKKFVNREEELEYLKKSYNSAKEGTKKLILIEGPTGVGKTQLALELFNSCNLYPRFMLRCRQENLKQQYGAISSAFSGFLDSLRLGEVLQVFNSLSDIDKYVLVSLVDKLNDLATSASINITAFAEELQQQQIFAAFTNFIRAFNLKIIPVLISEILWIDRASLEIINWILEEPSLNKVFIVGTLSKEVRAAGAGEKTPALQFLSSKKGKNLETINLEPFTESTVSKLLQAVFGDLLLPAGVEKAIHQLSEGIPANVEEIIKYLVENRIIYPQDGRWVFDQEGLNKIPLSLKEVINKRISALDAESREMLMKAAILGNEFDLNLLKLFSKNNEGQLFDVLDTLSNKGIFQNLLPDESLLNFVNTDVKNNIYNSIEKDKLQLLHAKVAELLETSFKTGIDKIYAKLMHHLGEAGEFDKLNSFLHTAKLPPYAKEDIAEVFEPTLEEIIEGPLSKESEKIVPEMLLRFRIAWMNAQFYRPNNEAYIASIKNVEDCIMSILENDATLTLSAAEQNIVINGQLFDRKKTQSGIIQYLVSLFAEYRINSITFKKSLKREEIKAFFLLFSQKGKSLEAPDISAQLAKLPNIKIDKVKYVKASLLSRPLKNTAELFRKIIPEASTFGNLFSVKKNGLKVNQEMFFDQEKTIESLSKIIKSISQQDLSEDNKSSVILEVLYLVNQEFAKKDLLKRKEWESQAEKILLSLEPVLRSKIIQQSTNDETKESSFIVDILSGLDTEALLKKADVGKTPATEEILNRIREEIAKAEKTGSGEKGLTYNLKSLTENLVARNDRKLLKEFAQGFLDNLKSPSPVSRIFAIQGIGTISEALLEKDISDVCAIITEGLIAQLKAEKEVNVYLVCLSSLEKTARLVIDKQNLTLWRTILSAIKEELTAAAQKSTVLKSCAEDTIGRILNSENIKLLLFCFTKKKEDDCLETIDLMAQFGEKMLNSILELLCRKDDLRLDPLDIYMEKRFSALIIKKIGEKATLKLKEYLGDSRPFVVKNIIDVFVNIDDKRYIPYLEQATGHFNQEVQEKARNALEKLKRRK